MFVRVIDTLGYALETGLPRPRFKMAGSHVEEVYSILSRLQEGVCLLEKVLFVEVIHGSHKSYIPG